MKKKTNQPISDVPEPVVDAPVTEEIQGLHNEVQRLNENWKRALADYQNLLKRGELERQELMKYLGRTLVSKLIPTLDVLEMAAQHSQDQGVQMAVQQFRQVLQEEGVEHIVPAIGEAFDPTVHECIEIVPGETSETVAEVLAKGYKIGDYVIRPSKVKVFKN